MKHATITALLATARKVQADLECMAEGTAEIEVVMHEALRRYPERAQVHLGTVLPRPLNSQDKTLLEETANAMCASRKLWWLNCIGYRGYVNDRYAQKKYGDRTRQRAMRARAKSACQGQGG